ncbi:MAG TPA: peptide deformylase [Patescibacteria group bacterium]|nr:peptide deformylase [Patescibacteria group bacterium]
MSLRIYTTEDPEVRTVSTEISRTELQKKELQEFAKELAKAMVDFDGVGIAAPQVGKCIRMIAIAKEYAETKEHLILVNPRIASAGKKTANMEEGCLSVPQTYGLVERATKVRVKATQLNGETIDIKAKGMFARILQHEVDHLNGILFIDKATEITKQATTSVAI